jgi:Na+-translocating ferredoxin:NAD+ oxidoreductase subunit G
MKEMARYGFTLALICVIAAGLLAAVNSLTKEKIIAQAQAEEDSGLKEVLPAAERFEPVKQDAQVLYYKGLDKEGRLVGIAFKASGKGYSSVVETLVGMELSGKIIAVKVLSQNETPGLGARVAGKDFLGQFSGQDASSLNTVQAIAGATISSRAVMNSVRQKAEELRSLLQK